jgi:type IV secretion system protein VirB5
MLLNENTKLQVLYQAAQAEEWARHQREREQGLAGIGSLRELPPMGLDAGLRE